jgi:hypothetical protein
MSLGRLASQWAVQNGKLDAKCKTAPDDPACSLDFTKPEHAKLIKEYLWGSMKTDVAEAHADWQKDQLILSSKDKTEDMLRKAGLKTDELARGMIADKGEKAKKTKS